MKTRKTFHIPFIHRSVPLGATFLALGLVLASCGSEETPSTPTQNAAEQQAADGCSTVSIASMNWQSAEVIAAIDEIILSTGYGCSVELVLGDTNPTLTSMIEKGDPDVAPEAWVDTMSTVLESALDEGRLHYGAKILQDGGEEGLWIPAYIAEQHPEIQTIDDALARPDLFPSPENKDRGALYSCPSGWACQITTTQAFKAWDAEAKGFDLIDPGSAAGLDGSIAKAYERGESWLGYYWAPTSILGKYKMVKLDPAVPHNKEQWETCNSDINCPNPQKNSWPKAKVYTLITDRFKQESSLAFAYLAKRSWSNEVVNSLLAWMLDNQATGEDGANYFLKNYPQVWSEWVSPEVFEKVQQSL